MKDIADIGLLKMDFLGLRTLTVIHDAVNLIKKIHGEELDMDNMSFDDKKTYELLSNASTFGVFQLESSGMRDLLRKTKPSEFEDIISILALYRPGPMGSGMLDDFVKRKRGQIPVEYDHPKLEPILKETYGIIVYQEQVMKIPVALAGFSLVHADHLRRAMSKKIQSVMDRMRKDFVTGCKKHSKIEEGPANKLFDLIDYFSGYGFNRSHSAAYAYVSYQTAFLKANYPVEFMCALLNSEKNNTDKVVEYVKECSAMGLKMINPDVNKSNKDFTVVDKNTMMYGLLAIKNVGGTAIDSIIADRDKAGPYSSLDDLCLRVDLRLANKKVMEGLIKCGSLDCFNARRAQLMAVLSRALHVGSKTQKERASGQFSFFDMAEDVAGFANETSLPDIEEWHQSKMLTFEKDTLGYYISGHPLDQYQVEIQEFTDTSTDNVKKSYDGEMVRIVGLISHVKLTNTRRTNERMAIVRIEDLEGELEVVVFPSIYAEFMDTLREGNVVFLQGKISIRDSTPNIIANDVKLIDQVYRAIKSIRVDMRSIGKNRLSDLKNRLMVSPGKIPVYLEMDTKSNKGVQILVNEDLFVSPNEHLMNEIKSIVGSANLSMTL